jgi:hypothetical protein
MKNVIFILMPLFVLTIGAWGCHDKEEPTEIPALQGTKWKLVGYTVGEEDMLRVFEPVDCEECYTLTFETNTFATGRSVMVNACIDLSDFDKYRNIEDISEPYDGDNYRIALASVNSCSVTDDELKLFYSENSCLIYKRMKQ